VFGSITTGNREFTEFVLEKERRRGNVRKLLSCKEVRPWKPVTWHEEPVGYQIRYQLSSGDRAGLGLRFPPDWGLVSADRPPAPALSPRRRRSSATDVRTFESLTEKQLEGRLNDRSVLTRLAAATELGRRPGTTPLLIELLRRWCPAVRFGAARALGQRKAKDAVPALLGVLFRKQDVAAVDALACIGDRRALEPLLTVFEWWRGWNLVSRAKVLRGGEPCHSPNSATQEWCGWKGWRGSHLGCGTECCSL